MRRYRSLMIESRYAFLRLNAPGWQRQVCNSAPAGRRELEQVWRLTAEEPNPPFPVLHFKGTLDRPAFAEITEVNPLPQTGAITSLNAEAGTLRIDASALPAFAEIRVEGSSRSWEVANNAANLVIGSGGLGATGLELMIVCSLHERGT